MRKLTKSERRLSLILGLALFGIGNFYGISYLMDEQSGVAKTLRDRRGQERSDQLWLLERELWLGRKAWIESKQPRVPGGTAPQADLLQSLVQMAKDQALTIEEQGFGEAKNTADYRAVAVKLKLSGKLENVVKYLVAIQQPDRFHAVTSFALKSANEPPSVTLELEVARWYSPHA